MRPYHFKTLRSRLTTLLISPVVVILLATGVFGFIYARNAMLVQWDEHVTLQLEQGANEIETALSWPVELMKLFSTGGTEGPGGNFLEAIAQELNNLPGVVRVNLNWHGTSTGPPRGKGPMGPGSGRFMRFHRGAFTKLSLPVVDEKIGKSTVSLNMMLMDAYDTPVGSLEIVLRFDYLVSQITADVWWQNATACIADRSSGDIMLTSGLMKGRKQLGETGDPLEQSVKSAIRDNTVGTLWGQGQPPERVAGFHSLDTFPWSLVVFADGKTILRPIISFRNGFIIGAALLILLIYAIIRLNVDRISGTIGHLSQRAGTVAAGDYEEKITVSAKDEIGRLAASFNTMIDGLKERDAIRNTFGRYVDPDFARTLLKRPEAGSLGGRRQEVAILMADIRGFTPMAEGLSPEDTIDLLNHFFSAIIPLIRKQRGIVVDFVGDAILAFFEPVNEPLAAATQRCLQCAFDMQAAMDLLNRQMAAGDLPTINMGVGINCGPVVVGNIGSKTRKKYGIVGSSVNITQRIQGQSDTGEVVVSEAVCEMIGTQVAVKRAFPATLKGAAATMQLYALAPQEIPGIKP